MINNRIGRALLISAGIVLHFLTLGAQVRPNVIFIIVDDYNDYSGKFGGHTQVKTPNIDKLAMTGISFVNAQSNCPVCAPSRNSLFTGVYPHQSRDFGWTKLWQQPVLSNNKTMMEYFSENGYRVMGSGKLTHHHRSSWWDEWGVDINNYGPFAYDGTKTIGHPSVPAPFRDIGAVDGSYAPLSDVPFNGTADPAGNRRGWIYGGDKTEFLNYSDENNRDLLPDEMHARWAEKRIAELEQEGSDRPFFMAVGFVRPHTPLYAPRRFFDMFPLDRLDLSLIKSNDIQDTHYHDLYPYDSKGPRYYRMIKESYGGDEEEGLKHFLQAYLASIAFMDEQVGLVLDALEQSKFKDNTVIIFTSDHGWHMGEKEYLFKNSPWEESARVPLIIKDPASPGGAEVKQPVSLVDLFPTLLDFCGLSGDNRKNDEGAILGGHSLKTLVENPGTKNWDGPEGALTLVGYGYGKKGLFEQTYSYRTETMRYIRYGDGSEELYDHTTDPFEWDNVADDSSYHSRKSELNKAMKDLILSNAMFIGDEDGQPYSLIKSSGFESGSLSGWNTWNNGVSHDRDHVYEGVWAGYIKAGARGSLEQEVNLKPNTDYHVSVMARVSKAGEYASLMIKDWGGKPLNLPITSTGFKKYTLEFTTGDISNPVTISVYKGTAEYGMVAVDNFELIEAGADERHTYYVDAANGNDDNDGLNIAMAWKSLDKVNSAVFMPGDSILFKAGMTWDGQLEIECNGTADQSIVFSRYGVGPKPRINGNGEKLYTLRLHNSNYAEASEFEITNTGASPLGGRFGVLLHANNNGPVYETRVRNLDIHDVNGDPVKPNGGGGGIVWSIEGETPSRFVDALIEGCHIYDCERNGIGGKSAYTSGDYQRIKEYYSLRMKIRNNLIERIPGDGIVALGCDSALVEYNICRDFTDDLPDVDKNAAAGIWPWNSLNTVIQHNEVSGHKASWDAQGFDSDWNCDHTIIQYNYSHDNAGGFILICSNGAYGYNNSTIVRYNISVNDGYRTWGRGANFCPSIHLAGNIYNTRIYNNTIYTGHKPVSVEKSFIEATNWNAWPNITFVRNNIFYAEEPTAFIMASSNSNSFSNNFYAEGTILPDDPGALIGNPQFANPGESNDVQDYMITASSPAIRQGMIINNNGGFDFFGNIVTADTQPNMGADNGTPTSSPFYISTGNSSQLFAIYPNPIHDSTVTVRIRETTDQGTISLLTLNGIVLESRSISDLNKDVINFDLSSYPDGMYLFSMKSSSGDYTSKFIKRN